jgi:hypothetical protein
MGLAVFTAGIATFAVIAATVAVACPTKQSAGTECTDGVPGTNVMISEMFSQKKVGGKNGIFDLKYKYVCMYRHLLSKLYHSIDWFSDQK